MSYTYLIEYLLATPPSLRAPHMEARMPLRDGDAIYEAYGEVTRETEKAVCVRLRGADDDIWLPKSQLATYPDFGEHGDIVMSEWIAGQKELLGGGGEEQQPVADEIPF